MCRDLDGTAVTDTSSVTSICTERAWFPGGGPTAFTAAGAK
ncbi:hypothetical protein M877_04575 [Streptomyces niveus NCIMB 11891]|nr:hypothetical protein M877_04575 [Streptomyces niveus NCIMB 11891]